MNYWRSEGRGYPAKDLLALQSDIPKYSAFISHLRCFIYWLSLVFIISSGGSSSNFSSNYYKKALLTLPRWSNSTTYSNLKTSWSIPYTSYKRYDICHTTLSSILGCQWMINIFYRRGPWNISSCWLAYREIGKTFSCLVITLSFMRWLWC